MDEVSYTHGTITTLKHGFFKRHGGVSEAQFSSLNVTARVGDNEDNASENRRRICQAIGFDINKLVFLDYLPHGNAAIMVDLSNAGSVLNDCDAIITTQPGLPIAIAVADCNPIVLTDETTFVALIHSGWRGTKANIIEKTVKRIASELHVKPETMKAVIGPSIAPQDYPVQAEVSQYFDSKYLAPLDETTQTLDLWTAVEDQLAQAGVGSIENLRINTYKNPDYYSYREDSGDTGRFMAIAQL